MGAVKCFISELDEPFAATDEPERALDGWMGVIGAATFADDIAGRATPEVHLVDGEAVLLGEEVWLIAPSVVAEVVEHSGGGVTEAHSTDFGRKDWINFHDSVVGIAANFEASVDPSAV